MNLCKQHQHAILATQLEGGYHGRQTALSAVSIAAQADTATVGNQGFTNNPAECGSNISRLAELQPL